VESSALYEKDVSNTKKDATIIKSKNPFELASWYAVEAFGRAFAKKSFDIVNDGREVTESIDFTKKPSSLGETLKRIKLDNDRDYFLSGEVDSLIYAETCTFADPFVSFDGRDRFIENLSNLGSFITNYDAKMIKYDVGGDGREIVTKVRFNFCDFCRHIAGCLDSFSVFALPLGHGQIGTKFTVEASPCMALGGNVHH
jgi:hypothetical protein